MKKVLFVATVVKTHIMEFHLPYLKMFKDLGWETFVAAKNDYENHDDCKIPFCDHYYDIPFDRFPLKTANVHSYQLLKKIIRKNNFDLIHCHTPVGAMVARLAANHSRKHGTRIIYTAHGFHFYQGAPLINWLVYFPAEWICSFMTDTLITINKEDFAFAQRHMHARNIVYVPGVGIDLSKFCIHKINPQTKRNELEIPENKLWILTVGELIPRKNHERLIKAVADIPNCYLTIAGRGKLKDELTTLINDLNVGDRVKLLGYRSDVAELCEASDVFAFPSIQEGLPVALMEAMACGKAIICSRIRGNIDLIDPKGGILFNPYDSNDIKRALLEILHCNRFQMGQHNIQTVQAFGLDSVMQQMTHIYHQTEVAK